MSASWELRRSHVEAWGTATTGAFLDGVADGTLSDDAFDRWLEQDYHFVTTLVRAWGRLIQSAPRTDFPLLLGGMTAFEQELSWFEEIATSRLLDLDADPLEATIAYDETLLRLAAEPYPVAITAMWAVEDAYLASWEGVLPGAPGFTEYVTHWANEEFAQFVAALAAIVDRELPAGPSDVVTGAYTEILERENAFWSMTTDC